MSNEHLIEQMISSPWNVLASAFATTFAWAGTVAATACTLPLLLISGATVTNDLSRLQCPRIVRCQTARAQHLDQREVPDPVHPMIERFLVVSVPRPTA